MTDIIITNDMAEALLTTSTALAEASPEELAGQINSIKQLARQTTSLCAIAIGQRLREARQRIPDGQWTDWLRDNVDYSIRTAENLIAIARRFEGDRARLVEGLSVTQTVLLLGVPEEDLTDFVEGHDLENMSTRELKAEVEALNKRIAEQQMTIDQLMGQPEEPHNQVSMYQEAQERHDRELDAMREELAAEQERAKKARAEADEAIRQAREALKKANENAERHKGRMAEMAAEADKREHELGAARADADTLRRELERTQAAAASAIPPETARELEELRAKSVSAELSAKYKAAFAQMKAGTAGMLEAMESMAEADRERYAGAAARALDIIREQVTALWE